MSFTKITCGLAVILLLTAPAENLRCEPEPLAAAPSAIQDYIDDLLAMQPISESRSGIRMSIEVVHDGYLYMMARKYEEYENYGFDEDLLVSKLKSDHNKYKRYQNRLYFRVSLEGQARNYILFENKLSRHLEVSQKSKKSSFAKKTYHILNMSPAVKPQKWQFYTKSLTRLYPKRLFGFQKMSAEITSYSLKATNKEPIYFRLKEVRIQSKSDDPKESINIVSKQISSKGSWAALQVNGPTIVMTPGNWDPALPPTDFLRVLKKVGYK